ELFIPASFDASVRVSRPSKNSLAVTALIAPFGREPASAETLAGRRALRRLGVREVALDQELRQARLRRGEPAAVLFQRVVIGAPGSEALTLGDDPPDLLAQRLHGLHCVLTVLDGSYENGRDATLDSPRPNGFLCTIAQRYAGRDRAPRVAHGMNFDLEAEHQLLRDTVRQFALERVAPVAEELDRTKRFPYEIVAELAELGLMGMTIPEEY